MTVIKYSAWRRCWWLAVEWQRHQWSDDTVVTSTGRWQCWLLTQELTAEPARHPDWLHESNESNVVPATKQHAASTTKQHAASTIKQHAASIINRLMFVKIQFHNCSSDTLSVHKNTYIFDLCVPSQPQSRPSPHSYYSFPIKLRAAGWVDLSTQ